ncbi:MAG TPA: TonB-dependent receptor [Woeseiaceae bacterium]|nr:TonB-dependent receptor [Woeseiaceae bacterium]
MESARFAAGAFLLAAFAAGPAAAQIEEIIVTATKREESVQDIPVAVSAYSGAELEKAGVTDIRGLMQLSPSFMLSTTGSETGGTTARIRGVGTQGNNPGLESAVGMYVDGVYRNRSTVGYMDFGPVERIEVLRGPQGTLFGKNTSVGVIAVHTEAPNTEGLDGYARLTGGDWSLFKGELGINGPIGGGGWAAGIDGVYVRRDGFYEDQLAGEDYNTRDRGLVRAQIAYAGGGPLSMRFIADAATRDEQCCGGVYIVKGARTDPAIEVLDPGVQTSDAADPYARETYTTPGVSLNETSDEGGVSGEIVWTADSFELTSITAWRNWESEAGGDLDYSGGDILFREPEDLFQSFETLSQEFQLSGGSDRFSWLVGLFYIDEDLDTTLSNTVGAQYSDFTRQVLGVSGDYALGLPFGTVVNGLPPFSAIGAGTNPGDGANDFWHTQSESLALYTRETFSLTDDLRLTVGLRYTTEDKELEGIVDTTGTSCAGLLALTGFDPNNPGGPITPVLGGLTNGALALQCLGGTLNSTLDGAYVDSRSEDRLSGTVNLAYFFSDDVMGYASYSNGYKSGGYNLDRSGLDPDTVLDGDTAGPNAATNFGVRTDVNALEFEEELVDAFEFGLKSVLADGRSIVNLAVYHQEFENFQLNTFNGLTFFVVTLDEVVSKGVELEFQNSWTDYVYTSLGIGYNDARYADDVQRSDGVPAGSLAGATLTHAPEWSVTGTLNWEMQVSDGWGAFAFLDARWTDSHNTGSDLDPEKHQPSYTVVNGRIGLVSDDDRWSIELWAQNLFDEEYIQVAFDSPIQNTAGAQPLESYSAFLGDPRTWGMTLGYRF